MEPFYFYGFEPADTVRRKANDLLAKVAASAPPGTKVDANLEFDGGTYHCGIEIKSGPLPFAVSMAARIPGIALDRAEGAILQKLDQWRRVRYEGAPETRAAG